MTNAATLQGIDWKRNSDVWVAMGVVGILLVMLIPLPRVILDLLLTFSLTCSILILLVAMYVVKPLEFSVFPSVLLVVTLLRLSLNVASTRLILLHGHEGPASAGHVIDAFGNFMVGGNYAVGLVVFMILVVVNFVVITKGAGRIAEVAARFTLDAMPGKQMAIDADLNAGLIDETEARQRRATVAQEADFYGAMDGASKFVRGDAIAAVIITLVNIIGGLAIGVIQQGLPLARAAETYTILTIGEGLVAQIPALIVSVAAGIVVTRAGAEANLGESIRGQILMNPKASFGAAGILLGMGLVPGLPHFAFFTIGGIMALSAFMVHRAQTRPLEESAPTPEADAAAAEPPEHVALLDMMELNVGYGLIHLVDAEHGGDLLTRVKAVRKQMALELGILVPPVHIRDNLQYKPNEYSILIKGFEVGRGELMPGHLLAIDPGTAEKGFAGLPAKDPCFGLPALWIEESRRERAQMSGYTVVDFTSIIATHLTEVVRGYAYELIGRQEVQGLLDELAKTYPKVVEELVPTPLPLGGIVRILRNLLRERVPIRDLRTILEAAADYAGQIKDPDLLTESVRQALARTITKQYLSGDGVLPLITLDPGLEQKITEAVQVTPQGTYLAIDPTMARQLLSLLRQAVERAAARGYQPVLMVSATVRGHLRRFVEQTLASLAVVSPQEIAPQTRLQGLETVAIPDG